MEQIRTLNGRRRSPTLECVVRRGNRGVELFGGGAAEGCEGFFGSGVLYREFVAIARDLLAADEKPSLQRS